MRLRTGLAVLVFFACSHASNSAAPPSQSDSGPPPNDADVLPGDGAVDAPPSYEQAVEATQWKPIAGAPSAPKGAKMDDIYFASAMVGYAVSGADWSTYKTTDGGNTWTTSLKKTGTYFRSLDFVDEDHGFAGNLGAMAETAITDTTPLYETSNGGTTWTPVTSISGPMPSGVCNQNRVDAQHLFAVGRVDGPAYFVKSSDGGMTWTSTSLSSQLSMLIDTRFTSPTDGIVIGSTPSNLNTMPFYCTILHTSDAGSTWQTVYTSPRQDSLCWKISFPSADVGYVSLQETGVTLAADAGSVGPPAFLKTTDGGQTWTEKPLPTNSTGIYTGIGIGFVTDNVGWVSPDYDQNGVLQPTYRTTDGGNTWKVDATLKSPINRFRQVDANTVFAIGGTMWKLSIDWQGGDL